MTLHEFDLLDEYQKAEVVWKAAFLADREEDGHILQLYSVDSFYIEVTYDDRAAKILPYRAFNGTQQLLPYLAHVKFNLRH